MKKAINVVSTILVVIAVIIAIMLVGVRLIGIHPYTVLSGSMEPTYHTGSLIYVKSVDPFELEDGDVITFMVDEDTLVTHRIVDVVPDAEDSSVVRFQTKGDANTAVDGSLVHYKNVIGSPIFTIPYMGYFANFVKTPPGLYVAIAGCLFILLLAFLPDMFDDDKDKNTKKEKKNKA